MRGGEGGKERCVQLYSCIIECTCQRLATNKAPTTPPQTEHQPPHHKAGSNTVRTWKASSEASIPTEMGPMLPTAILRAVSFLDGKVTQPVQVAPVVHVSSRHFSSCNNGSASGHGQTSGPACAHSNTAHVGFVWVAIFSAQSL